MNETVSNKTLVVLLVVAIGVSVMGIWVSVSQQDSVLVTGAATTDQGTATINIAALSAIALTDAQINATVTWLGNGSSGSVITNGSCTPSTACTVTTDVFTLENTGNTNVSVNVTGVGYDAGTDLFTTLTGGINAITTNNEASSCASGLANAYDVTNLTSSQICGNLLSADGSDSIDIAVMFNITTAETTGSTAWTWEFEGTLV